MKTFKFIVINKNNMKQIQHFATASQVAASLWGRHVDNTMVIVNESKILHLKDIPNSDLGAIQRALDSIAD